jgi:hypothetical protein
MIGSAATILPNFRPETLRRQMDGSDGRWRTAWVLRHARTTPSPVRFRPHRQADDHLAVPRRELRDNWARYRSGELPVGPEEHRPHLGQSALGLRRGLERPPRAFAR